jgi:hypothetical protein
MAGDTRDLAASARNALIASVVATFVLYAIPHGWYLAYPLMLISTVVHELGHGVAAILVGGDFSSFEMWSNGSGVAHNSGVEPGAARAFVSAGGLCGPAVAAGLFLWLGRRPIWAKRCLAAFAAFLVLALILWVRGAFGIAFVGALAAACILVAIYTTAETSQIALVFLATQLALSVYSRGDYLFKQWASTGAGKLPSDTEHMAEALGGPYWVWGLLCALFSAGVLALGAWRYVFTRRSRGSAAPSGRPRSSTGPSSPRPPAPRRR